MNSGREKILSALRQVKVSPTERPVMPECWIQYEDLHAKFAEVIQSVGGELREVAAWSELTDEIRSLPTFVQASARAWAGPRDGVPWDESDWTVDLNAIDDPHDLRTLDFAVFPGEFAVAENGAVWVTDRHVRQRTAYFITQHLVLVVPRRDFVHNMHAAYERLSFEDRAFGCFISGPSKTADIEQSLVIGAHGARSLIVYAVG